MKKLIIFLFIVCFISSGFAQLSGVYYIPQGTNPQGFNTLADAFAAVNAQGLASQVTFLIDDDLNEIGSQLILNRGDLSSTNYLLIKPAPQ